MSDTPHENAKLLKQTITSKVRVGGDTVITTIRASGESNDDSLIFTQERIHTDPNNPKKSHVVAKNKVVLGYGTDFETSSSTNGPREIDMATLQKNGPTTSRDSSKRKVTGRLEKKHYVPETWENVPESWQYIPGLTNTEKNVTVEIEGKQGTYERQASIVVGKGGKDDKTWTVIDRPMIDNERAASALRNKVERMLDIDEANFKLGDNRKRGDARKHLMQALRDGMRENLLASDKTLKEEDNLIKNATRVPEQIAKFVSKPEATWQDLPGGYGDKPPAPKVPDARLDPSRGRS